MLRTCAKNYKNSPPRNLHRFPPDSPTKLSGANPVFLHFLARVNIFVFGALTWERRRLACVMLRVLSYVSYLHILFVNMRLFLCSGFFAGETPALPGVHMRLFLCSGLFAGETPALPCQTRSFIRRSPLSFSRAAPQPFIRVSNKTCDNWVLPYICPRCFKMTFITNITVVILNHPEWFRQIKVFFNRMPSV